MNTAVAEQCLSPATAPIGGGASPAPAAAAPQILGHQAHCSENGASLKLGRVLANNAMNGILAGCAEAIAEWSARVTAQEGDAAEFVLESSQSVEQGMEFVFLVEERIIATGRDESILE